MPNQLIELEDGLLVEVEVPLNQVHQISGDVPELLTHRATDPALWQPPLFYWGTVENRRDLSALTGYYSSFAGSRSTLPLLVFNHCPLADSPKRIRS